MRTKRPPTELDHFVAGILAGPGCTRDQLQAKLDAVCDQSIDFVKRMADNATEEQQRRLNKRTKALKGS